MYGPVQSLMQAGSRLTQADARACDGLNAASPLRKYAVKRRKNGPIAAVNTGGNRRGAIGQRRIDMQRYAGDGGLTLLPVTHRCARARGGGGILFHSLCRNSARAGVRAEGYIFGIM